MKDLNLTKASAFAATALAATAPAFAQNSVTLYGIVDDSIVYQSSQTLLGSTSGGRSNIKTASGIWAGNRFGLKGTEDLGGGTKAIFQLESGFNINNGAQQYTNAMFGRQAWVGLQPAVRYAHIGSPVHVVLHADGAVQSDELADRLLRRASRRSGRAGHDLPCEQLDRLYVAAALRLYGERIIVARRRA